MNLLLIGSCMCFFALAVVVVAFRAAHLGRSQSTGLADLPSDKAVAQARLSPPRVAMPPAPAPQQVPIELLLLQIENHVRLERAAAESFLEFPTQALLHSKTTSPLVN